MEINKDYYRPITRHKYIGLSKLENNLLHDQIDQQISSKPREINDSQNNAWTINDQFFVQNNLKNSMNAKYGAITAFVILAATQGIPVLCYDREIDWSHPAIDLTYISIFLFIFSLVYYFTTPKREYILNRIDGTITFPGWFWSKNITMPFKEVKFTYDKVSLLSIIQPNWLGTMTEYAIWGLTYIQPDDINYDSDTGNYIVGWHDDLSFITWFMDKNRPLPPGNVFDPYRDIDFKRRKAEKFKHPLYSSWIPTPEATPEQQKEYDKHWEKRTRHF